MLTGGWVLGLAAGRWNLGAGRWGWTLVLGGGCRSSLQEWRLDPGNAMIVCVGMDTGHWTVDSDGGDAV